MQELYDLGGRQFCLAGLPPFGCTPIQITLSRDPDRACVDEQNWDAQVYNSKFQKLLTTLQGSLHGSRIVYLDAYRALMEILEYPAKHGNIFSLNAMAYTLGGSQKKEATTVMGIDRT